MFPSGVSEVTVENFTKQFDSKAGMDSDKEALSISDLDNLNPLIFEAAIGSILKADNYEITLTPRSNDKGADLVARSDKNNFLIQVKKSINPINDFAIGEILKSKGYYDKAFDLDFDLMIATNSRLNYNAQALAKDNSIKILDRDYLKSFLNKNSLFLSGILDIEECRLKTI